MKLVLLYLLKNLDANGENIAESLVAEGLAEVRPGGRTGEYILYKVYIIFD